ncbi:MarR family winged helix-turn-helix transcriptional regulator [Pseudonocardia sp.]|uniref:MarR family winged helix-turn-helix transcriptional regulator n=1 Tax=Pseudonocardia sp. TaxID=60912 RepID=UPI003D09C0C1
MTPSTRPLPDDRLAVGQVLVRLLQRFRRDVFALAAEHGVTDIREAHLHVFGNVGVDGVRLTTLARRAQLSLAACAELVDDLQAKGYLERRRDPSDGRAKLIYPTSRGREILALAGHRVAELETEWGDHVGPAEFEAAMRTLDRLVTILDEQGGGRDA